MENISHFPPQVLSSSEVISERYIQSLCDPVSPLDQSTPVGHRLKELWLTCVMEPIWNHIWVNPAPTVWFFFECWEQTIHCPQFFVSAKILRQREHHITPSCICNYFVSCLAYLFWVGSNEFKNSKVKKGCTEKFSPKYLTYFSWYIWCT